MRALRARLYLQPHHSKNPRSAPAQVQAHSPLDGAVISEGAEANDNRNDGKPVDETGHTQCYMLLSAGGACASMH